MIAATFSHFRCHCNCCCCCSNRNKSVQFFNSSILIQYCLFLLFVVVTIVVVVPSMSSINSVHSQSLICRRIPNLTVQQVKICQSGPEILSVIRSGIQLALTECERLFHYRKQLHSAWNCSEWLRNSTNRLFLNISDPSIEGTKEASFAHALFSAAVTHALSEACTRSNFSYCSCGTQPSSGQFTSGSVDQYSELAPPLDDNWKTINYSPKNWKWHGCGHNVDFGTEIARQFLDSPEYPKSTLYGLLNLHNNLVGRRIVKDELVTRCQCHGYSGSCTVRTCWRTLRDFQNAAQSLRSRYSSAKQVSHGWLIQSYRTKYEALAAHRSATNAHVTPPSPQSSSLHHHKLSSAAHQRNHPKVLTKLEQLKQIEMLAENQSLIESNQPSLMRHLSSPFSSTNENSLSHSNINSNNNRYSSQLPRRRDIIYLKPSINHCTLSDVNFSRQTNLSCVVSTSGSDSSPRSSSLSLFDQDWSIQYGQCESLCCGRGYRLRSQSRTEQCECQFKFCCSVACSKQCTVPSTEYECL